MAAFRALAEHAGRSFKKGERIIVNGRLRVRQWERDEKSGTSVEIEADALGHDLRWGVSRFEKTSAPEGAAAETTAGDPGTAARSWASAPEPGAGAEAADAERDDPRAAVAA